MCRGTKFGKNCTTFEELLHVALNKHVSVEGFSCQAFTQL